MAYVLSKGRGLGVEPNLVEMRIPNPPFALPCFFPGSASDVKEWYPVSAMTSLVQVSCISRIWCSDKKSVKQVSLIEAAHPATFQVRRVI